MNSDLRNIISRAPQNPGVYIMKSKGGRYLYVGKANNIKRRLKSYQRPKNISTYKTLFLMPVLSNIEFIICKNENEALILENNLIKEHKPKYNVLLRDDKTYPWIAIDQNHTFPRIFITRKKGSKYLFFGPYSAMAKLKSTIKLLRATFGIRNCKDAFFNNRIRPCLSFQIKLCSAPCVKMICASDYGKRVADAIRFLNGDYQAIIKNLQREMKMAAEAMKYEDAAIIRNKIHAIRDTLESQSVSLSNGRNYDIWGTEGENGHLSIVLLIYRDGRLINCINNLFENCSIDPNEAFNSIVTQYYMREGVDYPHEIIVEFKIENSKILTDCLGEKRSSGRTKIHTPKDKNQLSMIRRAKENAREYLKSSISKILLELSERLHTKTIPHIIECFDISNLGQSHSVGARVVMRDGIFDKSLYRRYKIKTIEGEDDYGKMREVLRRRMKDDSIPDLIVIDGGIGHLNAACSVLKEFNSSILVVSISKGIKRRDNFMHLANQRDAINLNDGKKSSNLLIRLRDEAHRFAISYHRMVRNKSFKEVTIQF